MKCYLERVSVLSYGLGLAADCCEDCSEHRAVQPPALHHLQPFLPLCKVTLQGLLQGRQDGTLRHRHRAQDQAGRGRGQAAEKCLGAAAGQGSEPELAFCCALPFSPCRNPTQLMPLDSPFLRDTLGGDLGELYAILVPGEGRVISEPYNQAPLCWGKSHAGHLLRRIWATLLGGSLGRPLGPFQERLEMLQLKSREKRHGGQGCRATRAAPHHPSLTSSACSRLAFHSWRMTTSHC